MIEPIMYFGIGFLVAALIGLVVVPLVHGRAVRLTMHRLEAATPVSIAEVQADKDQLRAEFAMSTRRLEMSVEQLKAKSTAQFAELGKKSDAINHLKIELGEKTAAIFALEARNKALHDQLHAAEDEAAARIAAMSDAERAMADKEAALARLVGEFNAQSSFVDTQKIEIATHQAQIEALKEGLADAGQEVKAITDRREAEHAELRAVAKELRDERGKSENFGQRASELEQRLAAQAAEADLFSRRAQELERQLFAQSKALAQSEVEIKHLTNELSLAHKIEAEMRGSITDLEGRAGAAVERLKNENVRLQADLEHASGERDRLARDIATMKHETEEAWASERADNAQLRERINGVAAEVARLAANLEGPNSPIDAILAAESVRGIMPATSDIVRGEPGNGNLADRIRALKTDAPRVPRRDDPQRRN